MCGALSDERTGLSFTIAAGLRQSSHSRVRVPWGSRPYFSVSNSRLPFLSPLTTRRATVEVFDPASTRDNCSDSSLVLRITSRHGPCRKHRSSVAVRLLLWNSYVLVCRRSHCLATVIVVTYFAVVAYQWFHVPQYVIRHRSIGSSEMKHCSPNASQKTQG
jgi:hypothetical protein